MASLPAALDAALDEARGLWLPLHTLGSGAAGSNAVRRVHASALTPLVFLRDFVATNTPVVIQGATDGWRARARWTPEYLSRGRRGDALVVLSVTPDGWADALHTVQPDGSSGYAVRPVRPALAAGSAPTCVCGRVGGDGDAPAGTAEAPPADSETWFIKPEERPMTLREAVAAVAASGERTRAGRGGDRVGEVAYLSYQNDSLRAHTPGLLRDLQPARRRRQEGGGQSGGGGDGGDDNGSDSGSDVDNDDDDESGGRRRAHAHAPFPFNPWRGSDPPAGEGGGGGGGDASGEETLEAVNLWVGTGHSTSSLHKDFYHNLYAVISGAPKAFTLLPPTDAGFLHEAQFPSGSFMRAPPGAPTPAGCAPGWRVAPDATFDYTPGGVARGQARVPWVPVRPDGTPGACTAARRGVGGAPPRRCPHLPLASRLSPVSVTVHPGEVLYLPPLWFHQVRAGYDPGGAGGAVAGGPGGISIAVNWWTNMSFGTPLWAAYQMARALAPLLQRHALEEGAGEEAEGGGEGGGDGAGRAGVGGEE